MNRTAARLWDLGLVLIASLFLLAACRNTHDDHAAEAWERARSLDVRAAGEPDPNVAAALALEADRWEARAKEAEERARQQRSDDAASWGEIITTGLLLAGGGGFATYKMAVRGAARAVNDERDALRVARGEPVGPAEPARPDRL